MTNLTEASVNGLREDIEIHLGASSLRLFDDYVAGLRKIAGGLVDVVAAVRRDSVGHRGLYWLARRDATGQHGGLAGMWEYPGGKVEPGEQLKDALRRELDEEFGVYAQVGQVLDSIVYGPYRVTFFEVHMPDPVELRKHTEARWMTGQEACAVEHLPSGTIFNARHLARFQP
jgi:8-oxo-dGTP diphosphatase